MLKGDIRLKIDVIATQSTFTCLKLAIETLEQGMKYFIPCSSVSIVNFKQVSADWEW